MKEYLLKMVSYFHISWVVLLKLKLNFVFYASNESKPPQGLQNLGCVMEVPLSMAQKKKVWNRVGIYRQNPTNPELSSIYY